MKLHEIVSERVILENKLTELTKSYDETVAELKNNLNRLSKL